MKTETILNKLLSLKEKPYDTELLTDSYIAFVLKTPYTLELNKVADICYS